MSVVSIVFLIYILIVSVFYFIAPIKYRWIVLLGASYVFYWLNSSALLLVLMFTTGITFLTGLILEKMDREMSAYLTQNKAQMSRDERRQYKSAKNKGRKRVLILAICINLGMLIFLKYYDFLGSNVNSLLSILRVPGELPIFHFLLPLGISFYTLQSIAYMTDVYRKTLDKGADHHLGKFALFMSFFPQLIQGPIPRYDQLAEQLYEGHRFDYNRVTQGCQLILWGFMKKMIVADRIGIAVNTIFGNPQQYEGFMILFAGMAYGLQVYTDFSGGIDIVRGAAQIWGIDMAQNFARPYFARSLDEFWRRWHMSLGNFMREYVFYPLSLSKAFGKLSKRVRKLFGNYLGKKIAPFLATFIVFLLVGIWHGSSWKYVAYGLWNGVIIVSSILLEPLYEWAENKFHIKTDCFSWKFFQAVRTALLSGMGRLFPRAGSCMIALGMFRNLLVYNPWVFFDGSFLNLGLTSADYFILCLFIVILFVVGTLQEKGIHIREAIAEQNLYFRWMIYLGAFVFLLIYGLYGPEFDISEFIYEQF